MSGGGGVVGGGFTPQRKAAAAAAAVAAGDGPRKPDKSPDKVLTPHADLERFVFNMYCLDQKKNICKMRFPKMHTHLVMNISSRTKS